MPDGKAQLAIGLQLAVNVLLVGSAVGQGGSPQTRQMVLGAATCLKCRITATPVGQIGGRGDEADDAGGFNVFQALPDGSILGLPLSESQVWQLDANGRVLRRIGRAGEGPGEFRRPASITLGSGDSAFVYDRQLARMSVVSSSGVVTRSFRVPPGARDIAPLGGTKAIATGLLSTNADVKAKLSVFPYHFIRGDSLIRSFGEPVRSYDSREPFQLNRILVPYRGSILIIARAYRYSIEHWDTNGNLLSWLVREPEWFRPYEHYRLSWDQAPPAQIIGAWIVGRDQLWVAVLRAGPKWQEAFAKGTKPGEGGVLVHPLLHPESLYESVVEVIDLKKGQLVASSVVPGVIHYVFGAGLVGEAREGTNARYTMVYRLSLH